jgi:hypothetical protein
VLPPSTHQRLPWFCLPACLPACYRCLVQVQHELACRECGAASRVVEEYIHLSLELPEAQVRQLRIAASAAPLHCCSPDTCWLDTCLPATSAGTRPASRSAPGCALQPGSSAAASSIGGLLKEYFQVGGKRGCCSAFILALVLHYTWRVRITLAVCIAVAAMLPDWLPALPACLSPLPARRRRRLRRAASPAAAPTCPTACATPSGACRACWCCT